MQHNTQYIRLTTNEMPVFFLEVSWGHFSPAFFFSIVTSHILRIWARTPFFPKEQETRSEEEDGSYGKKKVGSWVGKQTPNDFLLFTFDMYMASARLELRPRVTQSNKLRGEQTLPTQ